MKRDNYCEYVSIIKRTKHEGLLRSAHLTIITKQEARDIVRSICERYYLPQITVLFRGMRGRGNPKAWRISLPSSEHELDGMGYGIQGYGTLRVGIVLHEVAHVLGGTHHDQLFVDILDALLVEMAGE